MSAILLPLQSGNDQMRQAMKPESLCVWTNALPGALLGLLLNQHSNVSSSLGVTSLVKPGCTLMP